MQLPVILAHGHRLIRLWVEKLLRESQSVEAQYRAVITSFIMRFRSQVPVEKEVVEAFAVTESSHTSRAIGIKSHTRHKDQIQGGLI